MKIKVCGITSLEQIQQLQHLGVDYAGMIFYKGSKRFAVDTLGKQKSVVSKSLIKKVGVFVNADYETIVKAIEDYGLSAVQLHGDETDEFCLELMDRVKVIKVFRISGEENIDSLTEPFQNVCHYFLFDTSPSILQRGKGSARPSVEQDASGSNRYFQREALSDGRSSLEGQGDSALYGGTGKQFNWAILENAKIDKPFFLSGGIGLEDVDKLKAFHHPYLYAVDVNSRFETEPGVKDMIKVQQLVNTLNHE